MKLWSHQEEARLKAQGRKNFALFMEVGTGKTGTCITILRDLYNRQGKLLKTLILGPPIVLENWRREFAIFSKIPKQEILVLTGAGKKRLHQLKNFEGHIVITNYEVLSVPSMAELYEALLLWGPEALVLDESHRVKDHTAKRTKKAIQLGDRATYKYILTGTPILNSLMDLWSQYRVLDGGRRFGPNFWAFRARYFYDKNKGMPKDRYFPDWVTRDEASAEIKSLMESNSMHVSKEECLDLPPLVKRTIEVDMDARQARIYKEMKQDFITFLDDKACKAELALTKALRLQQIVSGFVPVETLGGEKSIAKFKVNYRLKALEDLLVDITPGHKVIVWAVFKENYKDIGGLCEKLKIPYVEIHGEITTKNKQENVDAFNNEESIRVLIGHPGSGGIGINLVAASYSIFYSRSFSLEYDIQAEARNYRGGSERHAKITRLDLVTPGTIDELVMKSLASKQSISYHLLKESQGEL